MGRHSVTSWARLVSVWHYREFYPVAESVVFGTMLNSLYYFTVSWQKLIVKVLHGYLSRTFWIHTFTNHVSSVEGICCLWFCIRMSVEGRFQPGEVFWSNWSGWVGLWLDSLRPSLETSWKDLQQGSEWSHKICGHRCSRQRQAAQQRAWAKVREVSTLWSKVPMWASENKQTVVCMCF